MFKKSLLALALVTTAVVASSSHEAVAAQSQSQVICSESSQGFPVCTGYIGDSGSGGASEPRVLGVAPERRVDGGVRRR
ncbi:MAG: hypothetical protein U0183_32110 [Polyangiaceae bacterium]